MLFRKAFQPLPKKTETDLSASVCFYLVVWSRLAFRATVLVVILNVQHVLRAFLGGEVKLTQVKADCNHAKVVGIEGDVVAVISSSLVFTHLFGIKRAAEVVCPSPLSGGFGTFTL